MQNEIIIIGSSLYRVSEAVAMLSLRLCASVVLLEMLSDNYTRSYGIQPQRHRANKGIRWNRIIALPTLNSREPIIANLARFARAS